MRSYFFSADTQEDMLGWVRALSQSASMETDGFLGRYVRLIWSNDSCNQLQSVTFPRPRRRCSSYQDFTKIGGSSESVDLSKPASDGAGPALKHRHISRTLSEPSHLTGGRMGTEHRGRRTACQRNSRLSRPVCVCVYEQHALKCCDGRKDENRLLSSFLLHQKSKPS